MGTDGITEEEDSNKLNDMCEMEYASNEQNEQCFPDDGKVPAVGMRFNSREEAFNFYKEYSSQIGFDIMQRSSASDGGILRYFTIACDRAGKNTTSEKSNRSRPSKKTDCKAKITAIRTVDEQFVLSCVELTHNHSLSPSKVRFFRGNKHIDTQTKKRLELNDQAGIPLCKSYNVIVEQAGGYENLTCGEKEARNYIEQVRRLKLGEGDAKAVHNYFVRMRQKNPQFYHSLDIDDEGHLKNMFWADARSRAAYESFGDVVCFDSTYLTNKYDMPFAPFVGVNHHGQSILLGCGLISSESKDNYVWLFKTWLECMYDCAPQAIITDQCKSIQGAVKEVFPNTFHALCRWHIMNKIPQKLSSFREYHGIINSLNTCVYDTFTVDEFERAWSEMIHNFDLEGNEWLESIYRERERWIPVFTKWHFLAGMSSSQRSESMNSFFDDYINSRTTLRQFVEQYEKALKRKIEKEAKADFDSFNTKLPLVSKFYVENQLREIYTNSIFKKFQEEIKDLIYCTPKLLDRNGANLIFSVRDFSNAIDDSGKIRKENNYQVLFDAEKVEVHCICCSFEFRGILCRHVLCVLMDQRVTEIPSCYILARWRKDIKRPHNFINISCSYDDLGDSKQLVKYNQLYTMFNEAADIGSQSDYLFDRAKFYVGDMVTKLHRDKELSDGQHTVEPRIVADDLNICPEITRLNEKILSPHKVNRKGRPVTKRKMSKVEKIIRTTKTKVTNRKNTKRVKLSASQGECRRSTAKQVEAQNILGDCHDLINISAQQKLSFTQLLQQYPCGSAVNPFNLGQSDYQNSEKYYDIEEPAEENGKE